MPRSARDLRDIINVSRLSLYDEDEDNDSGISTECSLEDYLSSRCSTPLGESSFITLSTLTRPGTSLGRHSAGISNNIDKRPRSAPSEKRTFDNENSTSYINNGNASLSLADIKKVPFPNKYIPVPPIGKKIVTKKEMREPMVFDNLFSYLDSTVVNMWLESCNKIMRKLTDFVLCGDEFVEFASYFLHKLSFEQYCHLLDLEFSILIDHMKYALHTGYHSNVIKEKDLRQLTLAIFVEYPNVLKEKNKGRKSLLDILLIIASKKSENYRKLLRTVNCCTINKQYIQWLLSIRAFGLLSFVNGIINFYENIIELSKSESLIEKSFKFEDDSSNSLLNKWTIVASRKGYIEVLSYLYTNQGVDLSTVVDEKKRNLLFIAVAEKNLELFYYLTQLDVVIDINAPSDNGNNALLYAISKNDLELVKVLVEFGADLNDWNQQSDGATALHLAVLLGCPLLVTFLLDNGADKSALMGVPAITTPLILAKDLGNVEIIKILQA